MSAGLDTVEDIVDLSISSPNPGAARLIHERLGIGENMLRLQSDGTGIDLPERGTIEGRVLDAGGRPVAGIAINPRSPVTWTCGGGVGLGTDADGRFVLEGCAPMTSTIEAFHEYDDLLASVEVRPDLGETADVVVRLQANP